MRRILLISILLLAGTWAVANSGPYAYYHEKGVSVEGCLYGSDGGLNLMDDSGKTFHLTGKKTEQLEGLRGQRVRLDGRTRADIDRPGAMSGYEGKEAMPILHVSHVGNVAGGHCENSMR